MTNNEPTETDRTFQKAERDTFHQEAARRPANQARARVADVPEESDLDKIQRALAHYWESEDTVSLPVMTLVSWADMARQGARFLAKDFLALIPLPTKPRLVVVDLDVLKAAWERSGVDQGQAWDELIDRLEEEQRSPAITDREDV